MKAIQISEYGGTEILQVKNLPIPQPKPGEALIKLKAAGLNFIDIYMRSGRYPRPLPFTPGLEGAGIVEAVGEGVTDVKVGDRVAFTSNIGSYAEYNVVKAWQLIPLPKTMSFEEGAAFPLQGLTAQYLLHDFYKIKPNDFVLVHAAAGGVGLLLVQWLKKMGIKTIGTVSTKEKAKIALDAGADHIILYTEQNFVDEVKKITHDKGVDYILDGVGKSTFTQDLEAVRIYGHICIYGAASGPADPVLPNALQTKSITLSGGTLFNCLNTREEILRRAEAIFSGVQQGWLKLKVDYVFPLDEAAKAQQMLETRKTTGKVVLSI